jgi:hypothetical protein
MNHRAVPKKSQSNPAMDASSGSLSGHRPPRPRDGASARPTVNDGESPLSWLMTRKDRSGQPLISSVQYLAGERLRMDFERSMLSRRITTSWESAGSGGRGGNATAEMSDGAIAARQRYHKAMDAVGPELSSIILQVCCMASGIEQAERVLNLPQRSGKAVLGLALTGLARHYGLLKQPKDHASGAMSKWGLEDYRPLIAAPELEEA